MSKFEYNGWDGLVMVYVEEVFYKYNRYGYYKVIMVFKFVVSVCN